MPPSPRAVQARPRRRHAGAGLGPRVSGSPQGSDERACRRPRPLHFGRTLGRTPLRARRHTRAYARRCRARDCRVGGGPEWSGRSAGSPSRAPPAAPPRPAPRTRRAERAWGCKVLPSVRPGSAQAWARLCSAWLRIAVTAGLTVRPAVRPALPRAPRGSRHPEPPPACAVSVPSCCRVCSQPPVRPRSPFSSSPAALAPSPPPPIMARGPSRTSLGPRSQQLPLLSLLLLLLLRDADGSHTAAARPAPPAAADGLAGDKNPQRSPGDVAAAQSPGAQDMVAVHMLRLYEKYSRRGARPGGGNTVRSFRARLGK